MRLLTFALGLAVGWPLLSGCLDAPPPSMGDVPSAQGDAPLDGLGNATLNSFRFEGCLGAILVIQVPEDWARPALAETFRPSGLTQFTATLQFLSLDCSRVVHRDLVWPDARLFLLHVAAEPTNASWSGGDPSVFLLDAYVSSPELSRALNELGAPSQEASIETVLTPLPGGGFRHERSVSAAGARFDFAYDYGLADGATGSRGAGYHLWFQAAEGLGHLQVSQRAAPHPMGGLDGSALRLEGESPAGAILQGLPATAVAVQAFVSFEEEWMFDDSPRE